MWHGAPKAIATYEYGANGTANNLLVRGVAVTTQNDPLTTGIVLRTCYTYDNYGNRVSETKPAVDRSSCP